MEVTDPHRPYVDAITIPAPAAEMRRVDDIFDVWFDSAVASWATLGFPREREAFDRLWPADFITEGQDQTRGWFYSQLRGEHGGVWPRSLQERPDARVCA